MFKPITFLIALLSLMMAACGGSDDGSVVPNTGQKNNGGNGSSGGGANASATPLLGFGSADDFEPGRVGLSVTEALTGSDVKVTVNAVNKLTNELLTNNYQYAFSSKCTTSDSKSAVFTTPTVSNNKGGVTTIYRNFSCSGDDVITARLFDAGADINGEPLATASASLRVASPELGSGEGVDYRDGQIAGDLELVGKKETQLTVNVVNRLTSNSLVKDSGYEVIWKSSCKEAAFSIERQDVNNGAAATRYDANLTTCVGKNTITVELYRKGKQGGAIDTIKGVVEIKNGSTPGAVVVRPALGKGSGSAFQTGILDITKTEISAYEDTSIKVNLVDTTNGANKIIQNSSYGIVLSSGCTNAKPPQAAFGEKERIVAQGNISISYKAQGCVAEDQIKVELYSVNDNKIDKSNKLGEATGKITIKRAEIGGILYVGSDRKSISIDGVGNTNLPTLAVLTFKVVDRSNNPVSKRLVNFSISNSVTDSTKNGARLATPSSVTNNDGEVKAIINAGLRHTIVTVKATTLGTDGTTPISTTSLPISVTTGIPDQDSFSLVAEVINPVAYDKSGTEVKLTVFASDQFQNPVPDGTVVNFTAESGQVPGFCETTQGSCTVNWRSQGYRPGQEGYDEYKQLDRVNETDPKRSNASIKGLTTITAYTIGEAGYTDSNANGVYDINEPFESFPEVIRNDDFYNTSLNNDTVDLDTNARGAVVEFFADFNVNGVRDAAPTVYQGALCSKAAKDAGHCKTLMHVRDSVIIHQASRGFPVLSIYTSADRVTYTKADLETFKLNASGSGRFYILVQDANGNGPGAGTTVGVSGDGYKVTTNAGEVPNAIGFLNNSTLPTFGKLYTVNYKEEASPKEISISATLGKLKVTLDPPLTK